MADSPAMLVTALAPTQATVRLPRSKSAPFGGVVDAAKAHSSPRVAISCLGDAASLGAAIQTARAGQSTPLLGAHTTATQIAGPVWSTAAVVIATVFSTMLVNQFLGIRLGLNRARGLLFGNAVAISGASAALAICPVLLRTKECERFMLVGAVTVTLLFTIAMGSYPLIACA
jgi:hypothetical protein